MALPVILVDSATGSDTQASGAGPSTALFGTTDASFSGATVTLTAGTDLSGVPTDGSAALYLVTSTGVRFFKITASAGSGGATPTVDVTPNPAGTSTARTWAIGGKRASVGSSSSRYLFDNVSAAGDAMPGWTVRMLSGHTESISAALDLRRAGDTTSGAIIFEGESGAATLPKITATSAINMIVLRGLYQVVRNMELTAGAASMTTAITDTQGVALIDGVKLSRTSSNTFVTGFTSSAGPMKVVNCYIDRCSVGISTGDASTIRNNHIVNCTSHGISTAGNSLGVEITGNTIYSCGGDGINSAFTGNSFRTLIITHNVIDSCTSDGIELTGAIGDGYGNLRIINNTISNNGGYGLKLSNASVNDGYLAALRPYIFGNNTYGNTSGAYLSATGGYSYNACPWASGDAGANPSYTNAAGGDFSQGTAIKAQGYPLAGSRYVGNYSATYNYVDPGHQRQEAGGGGGGMVRHPGMNGGCDA